MRSLDPGGSICPPPLARTIPPAYLLLTLAHILLIWLLPWFPTQDGPSHVYNVHILADLLEGGKVWGDYFEHNLTFVPNLGFTIVTLPLLKVLSPLVAERVFLSVYVLLLAGAVPLLFREFSEKVFPGAYLVFPVMFNFNLMMGFYSYAMAVPLFLIAFSLSWHIRGRVWWLRAITFNLSALGIFIFHFIPFVFYLMGYLLIPLVVQTDIIRKCAVSIRELLIAIPSLLLGGWYLSRGEGGLLASYTLPSPEMLAELLTELLTFSTLSFSRIQIIPTTLLMGFVLFSLRNRIRRKHAPFNNNERLLFLFSGILTVVYLFAPFRLGEGSYFNDRFPWIIFLLISPAIIAESAINSRLLVAVACLSLIINGYVFKIESNKLEIFMSGINSTCGPGDFIMTYKHLESAWPRVDVIRHAASHYGTLKGCVDIGNYEAGLPLFLVRFKSNFPDLPTQFQIEYEPGSIYFSKYPSITTILGWNLTSHDVSVLQQNYSLQNAYGSFSSFLRNNDLKAKVLATE